MNATLPIASNRAASLLLTVSLSALVPAAGLAAPDDLLDFCEDHPDNCALSLHSLTEGWERHWNADRPQSLASVSKILFLIAYSEAVVDGVLDPEQLIPRDEWAHYVTLDGGAMRNSWDVLGRPQEVRLDDLVRMMILQSDNATPDWLLANLPRGRIRRAQRAFGFHDEPLAISGMFGTWLNAGGVGGEGDRVAAAYGDFGAAGYRKEVDGLFRALGSSLEAREQAWSVLCVGPPWGPPPPCVPPQPETSHASIERFVREFFTRSTTRSYATLMREILEGTALSPQVEAVLLPHLEAWLGLESEISGVFSRFGFKPGGLDTFDGPDVLTRAHYMELAATGERFVVVVFLQGLSGLDEAAGDEALNEFVGEFARDPGFRQRLHDRLPEAEERPELIVTLRKVKLKGQRVTVKARIENTSPLTIRTPFTVQLALVDPDLGGEEFLASAEIRSLRGYKGRNLTLKAKAQSSPAGKLATVVADPDGTLDEQNRDNNVNWERLPE